MHDHKQPGSIAQQCAPARIISNDNLRHGVQVFAWGLNSSGQLGVNDCINRKSPVVVDALWAMPVQQLSAGTHMLPKFDNSANMLHPHDHLQTQCSRSCLCVVCSKDAAGSAYAGQLLMHSFSTLMAHCRILHVQHCTSQCTLKSEL